MMRPEQRAYRLLWALTIASGAICALSIGFAIMSKMF